MRSSPVHEPRRTGGRGGRLRLGHCGILAELPGPTESSRSAEGRRVRSNADGTRHRQPDHRPCTPIAATEAELAGVAYNADGLVGAIVQEAGTGEVLMFAWMNEDALRRTLETGRMWYWSRSRQEYWCKGETSGDRQ